MARHSLVARRYAKSLLDIATEQNSQDDTAADMKLISDTAAQNRDLRLLLRSPIVKADDKLQILKSVFGGHIGSVSLRFIDNIVRKKREKNLEDIAGAYTALYRESKGILTAEITTAVPLTDHERQAAIDMAQKFGGKQVELEEHTNPSIIGGFILRMGDRQYDDSISGRLQELRRSMKKDNYITT